MRLRRRVTLVAALALCAAWTADDDGAGGNAEDTGAGGGDTCLREDHPGCKQATQSMRECAVAHPGL